MKWELKCRAQLEQVRPRKMEWKTDRKLRSTDERINPFVYNSYSTEVLNDDEDDPRFSLSGNRRRLNTERSQNSKYSSYLLHPMYQSLTDHQAWIYEKFVEIAENDFEEFNCSIRSIKKKCLDKLNLLRFWIARDFKLEAVIKMWKSWVEWRIEYRPDLLTKEDIKDCPLSKYFKIHKYDKDGNPMVVLSPGYWEEDLDIESWK